MILIIVESPTKARTIQGFLDKSYKVVSSKGHIIDLSPKSFGVDVEDDFTPQYVVLKKDVANELKKVSVNADSILLATDPDREGEAIAYHIQSLIKKPANRILIYEMTKDAVQSSINNPGPIDFAKVEAQQARRILDRLVGYEVSPLLWKVLNKKDLSAGRVQSVALRLICEKELEIRNFKPEEFWEIKCKLQDGKPFFAKLVGVKLPNGKEAEKVEKEVKAKKFIVKDFKKQDKQRNPYPPYITSTLQQDASARLKFSTRQTMRVAQELFEGVKLGDEGSVGLITYMRTDSLRVADKAIYMAREYIEKEFGKDYLFPKPRIYEKKEVMGAHEAIRPTLVKRTPESIKKFLTMPQFKLYSLIWQRFVTSQMSSTLYDVRTMDIEAGEYNLKAESTTLKFDGFTKVCKIIVDKDEEPIPELNKETELTLLQIIKEQKFTKPKPRYTEGTMVRELESKGIGRPSTYAPIISRIIEKEYVKKIDGKLVPTALGEIINKILVSHFPNIFNVDFTRKMEEDLDKIEAKETDRVAVLKTFYKPFKEDVIEFKQAKSEVKEEITEITDKKCELCGKPMVIKWGKYGKFLACSGFPECKNTKPITINIKCPKCDKGEFIEKKTKKGKIFYSCSNYPDCKFALWYKPVATQCPSCGYPIMVEKRDKLECPRCKEKTEIEKRDGKKK
ncbi:MAG: type I DNA topoisomerase [bacterium]|nr:type I DNA topoisomerase [bacterium]